MIDQASVWEDLSRRLQAEPMIMGERNTPKNLQNLYLQNRAIAQFDGQKGIIAFVALWPTRVAAIHEFGSIWVDSERRGHKLGSWLMDKVIALAQPVDVIFLITKNPAVIHLVEKHGWMEAGVSDWDRIIPLRLSCGPCDYPEKSKPCAKQAKRGECSLFIRR